MKKARPASMIPQLLATIISFLGFISLLLTSFLVEIEHRRLLAELESHATTTADQLRSTLLFPVWNAIDREIDVQLDWVMMDENVAGIVLERNDLKPPRVYRSRNEAWNPSTEPPHKTVNLIRAERTVAYEGKNIATFEIFFTKRFIERRIETATSSFVFLVVAEVLGIAVGLLVILRALIFQPLGKIERYAAFVSDGSASTFPRTETGSGEIRSLHASIEKMVTLLGERYEALAVKEKENEVLIQELFHRTRNSLQVLAGLISLRVHRIADGQARTELRALNARIQAMAVAQDQLNKGGDLSSVDLGAFVKDLAPILSSDDSDVVRTSVAAERVPAVIDVATPLGIALVELSDNAHQHAFPGGKGGTVSISLSPQEDGEVQVSVRDDGIGPPPNFDPRKDASLGLELVFALIEGQLHGRVEFDYSFGFSCVLRFSIKAFEARV